MSFKRAKVVMLPTNEKVTDIWESKHGRLYFQQANFNDPLESTNQHLYIVSDEEIKEGDWYLYKDELHKLSTGHTTKYPKIIATTDKLMLSQNLVDKEINIYKNNPDILPKPSDLFIDIFIKEYNKGNQIVDVLIEYDEITNITKENSIEYHKDSIQLKINTKNNTISTKKIKDTLKDLCLKNKDLKEQVEELLYKATLEAADESFNFWKWLENNWLKSNTN